MSAAAGALSYAEPGKFPSVILALVVHLLLAAFLFLACAGKASSRRQ